MSAAPADSTGPRPRRSDATRAAILAAARERFAADGYERATIRAIAADARIDPAMVMRYYGSKALLFAAAAEIDLKLPDPVTLRPQEAGVVLTAHFFDLWEANEALAAMLRAAATNEDAAGRARRIFSEQVGRLVAAVCPWPAEAAERAALIASQLLGVALTRYVLRLAPVAAMDRGELVRWISPSVQRYLTEPAPSSS